MKHTLKYQIDHYKSLDDKIVAIFYSMGLDKITTDSELLHTTFYKLRSQHKVFFEDLYFKTGGRFPYSDDLDQTFSGLMLAGLISQEAPWYRFYLIDGQQRKMIEKNIIHKFSIAELGEIQEIADVLKNDIKKISGNVK
jgi:hypothetical protein